MTEEIVSVETAFKTLKKVHSFLNNPLKAGRLYATYDSETMKSALTILYNAINKLEEDKSQ